MSAMYEPPREEFFGFALNPNPLRWEWMPQLDRKPTPPWRGGFAFTWLFLHVQWCWKYV